VSGRAEHHHEGLVQKDIDFLRRGQTKEHRRECRPDRGARIGRPQTIVPPIVSQLHRITETQARSFSEWIVLGSSF
jgi:hypothetical protein